MKSGYAWTFGEAPAPEKRTPSLPRPPAGPRNSNWAASPRRACFRLLGGFRIRFGYLERPQATLTENPFIPAAAGGRRAAPPALGHQMAMPGTFARLPEGALDFLSDRIFPVGAYYG